MRDSAIDTISGEDNTVLDRAILRATRHLVPILIAMYVLSYLDRASIGFARQAFQNSTGISDVSFAFGISTFFLGYSGFEFPSNLMLHRFGARRWLARIMISWGAVASFMLITHSAVSFSVIQFLLGTAEAGFLSGTILFMTYWFPARARGRIFGLFYFGSPLAMMLGGPISGVLLDMDGLFKLRGWQWLFLIQCVVTVAVGYFVLRNLTDRPADARWLTQEERAALSEAITAENLANKTAGHVRLGDALKDPRLLHFCSIYFLIQVAGYAFAYYMPSQISGLMHRKLGLAVGAVTAIPWLCAIAAAIFYPSFAVESGYRRCLGIVALLAIASGLAASSNLPPIFAVCALCFVAIGIICVQPIFWTYPTSYYTGFAAAGSLAIINAIGNLGGFLAPNLKVWAEVKFGTNGGLYVISTAPLLAAILFFFLQLTAVKNPSA